MKIKLHDVSKVLEEYERYIDSGGKSGTRVELSGNVISDIEINDIKLIGIGSANSFYQNVLFKKVNLSNAHLNQSTFRNCIFHDTSFVKVLLHGATINDCQFYNCDFTSAEVIGVTVHTSLFENCNFSDITFSDSITKCSKFINIKTDAYSVINDNKETNVLWT